MCIFNHIKLSVLPVILPYCDASNIILKMIRNILLMTRLPSDTMYMIQNSLQNCENEKIFYCV